MVAKIARRNASAARHKLSRHTHGYRTILRVKNIDIGARNRTSDRDAVLDARFAFNFEAAGEAGILGRTVAVDQLAAGPDDADDGRLRQNVPSRVERSKPGKRFRPCFAHLTEQARGQPRMGDACPLDKIGQFVRR